MRHTLKNFRVEILSTIAAFLFCLVPFVFDGLPAALYGDEIAYHGASKSILEIGLFQQWVASDLRTYFYPFLGTLFLLISDFFHISIRLSYMLGQFSVYVVSSFIFAILIAKISNRKVASACYTVLLLNVFNLIYTPYILTEVLSLCLSLLILGTSLWSFHSLAPKRFPLGIAVTGLLIGLAIATRPANIFILITIITYVGYLRYSKQIGSLKTLVGLSLLSFFFLVAVSPQIRNNIKFYNKISFLTSFPLIEYQVHAGKAYLKYATAVEQDEAKPIIYRNIFYAEEPPERKASLSWYFENPGLALVSIGIKVVSLMDQDLPTPYNWTTAPWYRWPCTILSGLIWLWGSIGLLASCLGRIENPSFPRMTLPIFVLFLLFHLGLHVVTGVEARFGLPQLMVLSLFFLDGLRYARERIRQVAVSIAFLAVFMPLSAWMHSLIFR